MHHDRLLCFIGRAGRTGPFCCIENVFPYVKKSRMDYVASDHAASDHAASDHAASDHAAGDHVAE